MKYLSALLYTFLSVSTLGNADLNDCQESHEPSTASPINGELNYLRKFKRKYPYQVHLLRSSSPLTKRLKALLKTRFRNLKERWVVERPIEIQNDIFDAGGCQPHNCDRVNFIIVVDLAKDVVYVGMREYDSVKTYSEDGTTNVKITEWVEAQ